MRCGLLSKFFDHLLHYPQSTAVFFDSQTLHNVRLLIGDMVT